MFCYISRILLFVVLAFPATLLLNANGVQAQEDPIEDEGNTEEDTPSIVTEEDTDSKVETDEEVPEAKESAPSEREKEPDIDDKPAGIGPSSDVETSVLFPDFPDKQLPAGKPIRVLVGFANKGEKDFIVETLDASFRYPQDYNYHIQNFSVVGYNTLVQPNTEVSFQYAFHPHESYGGRPFGLTVMIAYKDSDGNQFGSGVFNETITFQETDEGFDGETFFMYVFLAAVALLGIFGLNYAFSSVKGNKRAPAKAEAFEQGTQNSNVDYDWLPKETTTDFNKPSPRQSPRQRRAKRSSGSSAEE